MSQVATTFNRAPGEEPSCMEEAYVQLLCPECKKDWESTPMDLPGHTKNFECPDCHASRRLAEFARTERDLETIKQFE